MDRNKIWFLYNRKRATKARQFLVGQRPDDELFAFHHLKDQGFDTHFSDAGFEPTVTYRILKALDNTLSGRGKKVGFHIAQAWALREELNRADLVFACADSSALAALALKDLGIVRTPIVCATIGLGQSFPERGGLQWKYYRRLLKTADRIVHYGAPEGIHLRRVFDVAEEKIRFIPFGVQSEFFKSDEKRDRPALAVGFDPLRDWALLFQAVREIDLEIDLVCNPDSLAGLDVPGQVNLIAPVSMLELRRMMGRARFVILPVKQNNYTGATITLLQAMAAGCAVVISKTDALKTGYPVIHEKTCLLVNPGDVGCLAKGCKTLNESHEMRNKIGKQAAIAVFENNDIRHLAENLGKVFREVLS